MNKIFSIVFVLLAISTFAQRPYGGGYGGTSSITGKIEGVIMDGFTNEPVPFATVAVFKKGSDKPVNGMVTSDDGSFRLVGLPLGELMVKVSFVGYQPIQKEIELTPKSPDAELGTITLATDAAQLDEVVVSGDREVIENKIDRIVYNAEQDVANMGGDAADVLRRAPLLSVDLEGNVSLRGSQNIQILINGKPSNMFATSPADALRVIPADNIKQVEVITTPGAKYDGEGTAGIINIITKKTTPQGFSGNTDLSLGTRINRGVLGINAGKGRFGMNANGSMFHSWMLPGYSDLRIEQYFGQDSSLLTEDGDTRSGRTGYFLTAGAYYDFNAYNSLTSSLRYRGFSSRSEGTFSTFFSPFSGEDQEYTRTTDNRSTRAGYEFSLDYIKKFADQDGREFSISYKVDADFNNQDSEIFQEDDALTNKDMSLYRNQINTNDGTNTENTFQVDYVHPFGKSKLEVGAKAVLRHLVSDFQLDTFNIERGIYQVDPNQTSIFDYYQNIGAGYISVNSQLFKTFGVVAGVRYEATEVFGDVVGDNPEFDNNYANFLPSIILSKTIGRGTTIKTSYARRIQRPSLRFVNPFVEIDNNRNVSFGNPLLLPEITDQYDISYSTFKKGAAINVSVFYRDTKDVIESIISPDTARDITVTTFQNIGQQSSLGTNVFLSKTFFDIWTVRGGVNIFTYNATGNVNGQQLSNQALLWNGNMNSQIKLKNDLSIDMFGFYRSPRQTIQGVNPSFWIWGLGARKEIWDGKGSIGLRFIEPLVRFKRFRSELESPNISQFSERGIPFQSYGFSFSYKFGKLDFKTRTRRSKIDNQDLKQGDNNGSQF